jgi:hypothetical protein
MIVSLYGLFLYMLILLMNKSALKAKLGVLSIQTMHIILE